ncbi:hypothetical protein M569_17112 [Genlisea aurea]|uniref:Uncharacterized protein n=1 Tax=Genlisea aurea TaxID=192259 RepID=S8BSX4_9LAMI|nr:hypothetical protein M569_17112 [Genlisea aurea]
MKVNKVIRCLYKLTKLLARLDWITVNRLTDVDPPVNRPTVAQAVNRDPNLAAPQSSTAFHPEDYPRSFAPSQSVFHYTRLLAFPRGLTVFILSATLA